jgi:hypothetical protein
MALVLKDRVMETSTTSGTGVLSLDGAVDGFQSFSVIGDGNTTYYTIVDGSDWEVGQGTYTASGTRLSRDTVLASSNSGSAINLAGNTANVFVTSPASNFFSVDAEQTLTNKTLLDYAETVYALTGTDLDPANGSIQTITLSANTTFTESLSDGQSMTLMIDDGTAYTITWPTMQWSGGSAPTLATTGYSVVVLWKVGSTLYGTSVGDMA